jgi:hypothetical protein
MERHTAPLETYREYPNREGNIQFLRIFKNNSLNLCSKINLKGQCYENVG